MKLLRLLAIISLALVLNIALAGQTGHAAGTGTPFHYGHAQSTTVHHLGTYLLNDEGWYDINNYETYCQQGDTSCLSDCMTYSSYVCYNSDFVEFVGAAPDAIQDTPGFAAMGCLRYTGGGNYIDGVAVAETAAFGAVWDGYYNDEMVPYGTISGTAELLTPQQVGDDPSDTPPGSETLVSSTSSAHVSVVDPEHGTVGTAYGVQNTDNTEDTKNTGGFSVVIRGWLYSSALDNGNGDTFWGSISCQVGAHTAASALFAAAATQYLDVPEDTLFNSAEGELECYPFYEWNHFFPNEGP